MAITSIEAIDIIKHAVGVSGGGTLGTPIEEQTLVNHAGHILVTMHPWRWLNGRMAKLTLRARIDFTGASWVEATRTLTSIGSFANYSFLSEDAVDITFGTNTTLGRYEIESKVDDDNIVLVSGSSLGASASAISGTLLNDQVELPSDFDFQRIIAYQANNALVNTLSLTSQQTLLDLRSVTPGVTTLNFWGIVNWVRSNSGGGLTPRFSVWPDNTATQERFTIFYRGGWREPATDSQPLDIPGWLEPLYIEVLKAVAMGNETEDNATLSQRLDLLKASSLFRDATLRDGMAQSDLGIMRGGGAEVARIGSLFDNETVVADPAP